MIDVDFLYKIEYEAFITSYNCKKRSVIMKKSNEKAVVSSTGSYEIQMMEMLLRHKLPKGFTANISVKTSDGKKGVASFTDIGGKLEVASNIADLSLDRIIGPACW